MNKKAGDQVRESEKDLCRVAEETGQMIYDYDLRTGRIAWSGAIKEITGYTPEEFEADIKRWKAMIHPRDRAKIIRLLTAARKKGRRFDTEYRFAVKGRGYKHLKDTGVFLKNKNGKFSRMIGTMTDITPKKEAETALENSFSLLQAALESTAEAILAVDRKGEALTSNQKFFQMWRLPPQSGLSKIDASFLEWARNQLIDPRFFLSRATRGRPSLSAESYHILEFKDGRVVEQSSQPQRIKKKIVGHVWSFRDVTEQKRAEKVKSAVYKISEIANMSTSLNELFLSIHAVIGELMPARNFYIALYDPETRILSFPYFVDEYDTAPPPGPAGKGLTEYVLRRGEPLLKTPEKFQELEKNGEVERVGVPSIDWLGVPLKVKDKTIGAMVVQTYTGGIRYTEENKAMMMFVSSQAALAIERKQTEERLWEAQRFLSNVFSSIQDGICVIDPEMNIMQVNSAIENWYAHAMPFTGKKCYEAYYGRKERCPTCPTDATLQTGKASHGVVVKMGPGGIQTGWFDIHTFPLIDSATGKMKGVIECIRDITEGKQTEEALRASLQEKEVLLKEIHHRVKNNMQVISSLLNLQARHVKDRTAVEMFKESQHRIRSMALVHEKLYQSKDLSRIDFARYVENLMTYLFRSYQIDSRLIAIKIEVENVLLDINTAIPCGLIVNELASNALKHAFPDGRKGEIRVALRLESGPRYVLTVSDNGQGLARDLDVFKTETLGMQLVVMLVDQLDGTLELERNGGTSIKIIFRESKYKRRI